MNRGAPTNKSIFLQGNIKRFILMEKITASSPAGKFMLKICHRSDRNKHTVLKQISWSKSIFLLTIKTGPFWTQKWSSSVTEQLIRKLYLHCCTMFRFYFLFFWRYCQRMTCNKFNSLMNLCSFNATPNLVQTQNTGIIQKSILLPFLLFIKRYSRNSKNVCLH